MTGLTVSLSYSCLAINVSFIALFPQREVVDDNMPLRPGGRPGFGGWGRGAGGGIKSSSQEKDHSSPAPTNRFMALSTGGASNDYDRNRSMGRGSSMGGSQSRGDSRSRLGGSKHCLGGRRGKNISRHSQKQDHEAALSAAR